MAYHIVRTASGPRCQTSKGKFTKNSRCGAGLGRMSRHLGETLAGHRRRRKARRRLLGETLAGHRRRRARRTVLGELGAVGLVCHLNVKTGRKTCHKLGRKSGGKSTVYTLDDNKTKFWFESRKSPKRVARGKRLGKRMKEQARTVMRNANAKCAGKKGSGRRTCMKTALTTSWENSLRRKSKSGGSKSAKGKSKSRRGR